MSDERITVRVTDNDSTTKVLVYSKRRDRIEVMLGECIHSVKSELTPTANGIGYAGSAMGRDIVDERTPEQLAEDIELANHDCRDSCRR